MFGGQSTLKEFKRNFPEDLIAARVSYPDARIEEHDGRISLPPLIASSPKDQAGCNASKETQFIHR